MTFRPHVITFEPGTLVALSIVEFIREEQRWSLRFNNDVPIIFPSWAACVMFLWATHQDTCGIEKL